VILKFTTISKITYEEAISGSTDAIGKIYDAFAKKVFNIAWRITGDKQTAEDITHDVFIKAFTDLKQLKQVEALGPWIRKIAIHMSINYLRKVQKEVFDDVSVEQVDTDTPENIAVLAQFEGSMSKSIMQLSANYRTVLWLHEVEGMTHREIASLCRCTTGYSKITLSRAIKKLRQLVDEYSKEDIVYAFNQR